MSNNDALRQKCPACDGYGLEDTSGFGDYSSCEECGGSGLAASKLEPQAQAQQRMLHDFPALQQFHTKHALGPMLVPSCLCCGQQTHPISRPVAVKHLELPGIVICKSCHDVATKPQPSALPDDVVKDAERLDWIARQGDEFTSRILVDCPGDGNYYVSGSYVSGEGATFRAAIDSAMLKEKK